MISQIITPKIIIIKVKEFHYEMFSFVDTLTYNELNNVFIDGKPFNQHIFTGNTLEDCINVLNNNIEESLKVSLVEVQRKNKQSTLYKKRKGKYEIVSWQKHEEMIGDFTE